MLQTALAVILVTLLAAGACADALRQLPVTDFAAGSLAAFKTKGFVGRTDYQLVELDGRQVLRATTRANA